MNRDQKRKFVKEASKHGVDKKVAKAYAEVGDLKLKSDGGNNVFNKGDKVRIDTHRIRSQKDYESKSDKYKEFINSSDGVVYEIDNQSGALCSLTGYSWLFFWGDLIKEG